MRKFYSHNNKELSVHLDGVHAKAYERGFGNPIIDFVSIFHDIAKCNIHFQNKFKKLNTGYNDHSYLSAYISLFLLHTDNPVYQEFPQFNGDIKSNIIANIIASHHRNLKNIDDVLNEDSANKGYSRQVKCLKEFLNSGKGDLGFEEFLTGYKYPTYIPVFVRRYINAVIERATNQKLLTSWQNNSLNNFFDTIFNFAQLIEADKRDASCNQQYNLKESVMQHINVLDNNLNRFLGELNGDTPLNRMRTEIRINALEKLLKELCNGERLFTLPAPTGSGKTLMMLALANLIQKVKGQYGIIMAIPFTSIIDQTSYICEKSLWLDVLNYTSVSNSSAMIDKLQEELESNPTSEEAKKHLTHYNFSEETMDHPFVVTTFVQFFQTLISNRNSTLIKLPNFTKRIILIDEYQSLPANLYTFFYALLQEFCERYDCYAILSTATMPKLNLNSQPTNEGIMPNQVFTNFKEPVPILDYKKFFSSNLFDRYHIENLGEMRSGELKESVIKEEESTLVVLNTIQDSKDLFFVLDHPNKYMLNRNFTIHSRLKIIDEIKNKLAKGEHVILVSTQLIEAGVDLDFPIVYRDMAPLPSLIQSAGRCNRNGVMSRKGRVKLFTLMYEKKQKKEVRRADLVYSKFELEFTNNNVKSVSERDMYSIQERYFEAISNYKQIGRVSATENLVDHIYNGRLEDLGNYRLIESSEKDKTIFVGEEALWDKLELEYNNKPEVPPFSPEMKQYHIQISRTRKEMAKHCVTTSFDLPYDKEIMQVYNLLNKSLYNDYTGLNIDDRLINFKFNK